MNIKLELLKNEIAGIVKGKLDEINIDADEIADTTAISVLSEIQNVIKSDFSDFETVEEIVLILEKYELSCGSRHDF